MPTCDLIPVSTAFAAGTGADVKSIFTKLLYTVASVFNPSKIPRTAEAPAPWPG